MHNETQPHLPTHDDEGSSEALSADALLRAYGKESSFFFATPGATWLGRGILASLPIRAGAFLDDALPRLFGQAQDRGVERPVAVGALPFDPAAAPILYIPERLERAGRLRHTQPAAIEPALSGCTTDEFPPHAGGTVAQILVPAPGQRHRPQPAHRRRAARADCRSSQDTRTGTESDLAGTPDRRIRRFSRRARPWPRCGAEHDEHDAARRNGGAHAMQRNERDAAARAERW
jgi:hypothetical protein